MSQPIVPLMSSQRIVDPAHAPARLASAVICSPPARSRRDAVGACLASALAALALTLALVPGAQAKPMSRANRAFVNATVEAAMREEHQPGVEISISGPQGSYTRAYGLADSATGAPLRLDDHIRVGSITKTFTANAILQQVQEGRMRLSDKLSRWIGGVPNGNRITVRELLAMRSGVYEYEADEAFDREVTANPLKKITPQELLTIIRENKPQFAPGARTLYTNSNYILLGLILEKVTGETAEAAITKDVIRPLGLDHTSFPASASLPSPFAHGYCLSEERQGALEDCTEFAPGLFWTDGAIVSTLADLHKYARELGTGALLTPKLEAERLQFHPAHYDYEGPKTYGYGLGIIRFGTWLGHDGSVPGFGSETFYEPRTGAAITGVETLQTPSLAVFSRIFERIAARLYPSSLK
ncbi:MAG: serine hydrolase domain-containing protein [Solirubrobacteraceae bacterium]